MDITSFLMHSYLIIIIICFLCSINTIKCLIEMDKKLNLARFKYVTPGGMDEETFWSRYFYRIHVILEAFKRHASATSSPVKSQESSSTITTTTSTSTVTAPPLNEVDVDASIDSPVLPTGSTSGTMDKSGNSSNKKNNNEILDTVVAVQEAAAAEDLELTEDMIEGLEDFELIDEMEDFGDDDDLEDRIRMELDMNDDE
jgi:hypothetical protein